jgi:hypothetical protein
LTGKRPYGRLHSMEGGSQRLMSVVSGQKTMGNADTVRITSILWRRRRGPDDESHHLSASVRQYVKLEARKSNAA